MLIAKHFPDIGHVARRGFDAQYGIPDAASIKKSLSGLGLTIMSRNLLGRVAFIALASVSLAAIDRAAAEPLDSKRVEDLEKENAAMRARIRRLEVETDNARLHAKLDQLQGRPQMAGREVEPAPMPANTSLGNRVREASLAGRDIVLADMNVKAAPLPYLPEYYNWTGFYVGGNVGYGVGRDRVTPTLATADSGLFNSSTAFVLDGGLHTAAPKGVIGGVQAGYNWQGGRNWLLGWEADFQGSNQRDVTGVVQSLDLTDNSGTHVVNHQLASHAIDYFGTFRGRVGFVSNDALFYVTGGGAYGRVRQDLSVQLSTPGNPGVSESSSTALNKFGYAVGAGLEASLGGNWTGKVEYLYMDLGSANASVTFFNPQFAANSTITTSSTIRDNIVRAGLNYRLNGDAPVKAYASMGSYAAPTPYSWTGSYVGGNVGYGFGYDRFNQTSVAFPGGPRGTVTDIADPSTVTPKGFNGGVQVGYNWQGGRNFVVGFEADFQGSTQSDNTCGLLICGTQTDAAGNSSVLITNVKHDIDYFGTIRGRAGFVHDDILFYATGGGAFGHVTQTTQFIAPGAALFANASSTADMMGYAVGGGIEAAIGGGWTAKAEYLYMDLGSISTAMDITQGGTPGTVTTSSTVRDHIVRLGGNYHF
jgi:outer membrane immunogenic protein